ncbi:hypothetical protein FWG95_04385, partial [Candidatus Saccharibacteria bacterium]|nr:hypothetical protein [Candidatus Saccharibacteria bacterium]
MKKKAKETKSKTSRRARNPRAPHISDEISPSFVAHQDLGKEKTAKDSSSNLSVQSEPKEPVRARLIFGRLFQNLAYICLFLGVMAVLGVVVAAVLAYWPQNSPATPGSDQFMNNTNNGGWVWVLLAGSLPGFMLFLQIIVGVAIILFIIWGWRAAIRSARRLVVR